MKRITFEGNFCDISMCRENPCPYNGMCSQRQTWERLKQYEDAEQEGRLVVLPCKVGDTVYVIRTMTHSEALKSGVPEFRDKWSNRKYARKRAQYRPMIVEERKMVKTYFSKIGKTVFLTREEAEAALKGGEG